MPQASFLHCVYLERQERVLPTRPAKKRTLTLRSTSGSEHENLETAHLSQ